MDSNRCIKSFLFAKNYQQNLKRVITQDGGHLTDSQKTFGRKPTFGKATLHELALMGVN